MHILLTGGGTGGHVVPNLALTDALRALTKEVRVSYIGSHHGPEKELCKEAKIPFYAIQTGKLRRYFDLQNVSDVFRIPLGFLQALRTLRALKPDLVFSKGGFVAVPVVLAAHVLKIPIIVHESDANASLSTRISAPFAREIWLGFESAQVDLARHKSKIKIMGNPVREELLLGSKKEALKLTGLSGKQAVLLVMGGSSGAQELNELIARHFSELTQHFDVIHLTGKGKKKARSTSHYYTQEYAGEELKHFYALADLALSRAGAGSLAELIALHLPTLLFPLGLGASRGDQIKNAEEVAKEQDFFEIYSPKKDLTEALQKLVKKKRKGPAKNQSVAQKMAERLLKR